MAVTFRALAPWHRRLAVLAGVALVVWIASALVMLLPWGAQPFVPAGAIPLEQVAVSPDALARRIGPPAPSELALRAVDGAPVWIVRQDGGPPRRFDARTGEPFALSDAQSVAIAARTAGADAAAATAVRVDAHGAGYGWGELPAVRVAFADAPSVWWFVDPEGQVRRSTRLERWRKAMDDLHRFAQLGPLVGDPARRALLVGFSLASLAVAASGYWLVWLRRPRRPGGASAHSRS